LAQGQLSTLHVISHLHNPILMEPLTAYCCVAGMVLAAMAWNRYVDYLEEKDKNH